LNSNTFISNQKKFVATLTSCAYMLSLFKSTSPCLHTYL